MEMKEDIKKDSLERLEYKKKIEGDCVIYIREDDISSKSIEFNLKDKVIHICLTLEKYGRVGVPLTMFEFRAIEDISKELGLYDFGRILDNQKGEK